MNNNVKVFVVYQAFLLTIFSTRKALIISLLDKEILILNKYLDYLDIFLEEKTMVLLKKIIFN